MVTYMLLIIAYNFVLAIAPQKAPQTMGRFQSQQPMQCQTIDRNSKHPSDRPSPLNPIALHCISDRPEMTPDTAACTSPNGCAAFETNARPRRSQSLSKGCGDRLHSPSACFGFDRPVTQSNGDRLTVLEVSCRLPTTAQRFPRVS
jgi:hypothetical protein